MRGFWGATDVTMLDESAHYMVVFSLWKFIQNTPDM